MTRMALLDRVRELHDHLPQEPPTFTHGNPKTGHIWATADGLTVMDFVSAPGRPGPRYRIFPSRLAVPASRVRSGPNRGDVREFLWTGTPPVHRKICRSAPRLGEAVELLKCAVRRVPLFAHDWASRIDGLVDRAEAAIHDVESHARFAYAANLGATPL